MVEEGGLELELRDRLSKRAIRSAAIRWSHTPKKAVKKWSVMLVYVHVHVHVVPKKKDKCSTEKGKEKLIVRTAYHTVPLKSHDHL